MWFPGQRLLNEHLTLRRRKESSGLDRLESMHESLAIVIAVVPFAGIILPLVGMARDR
jgi:hypothetical protein